MTNNQKITAKTCSSEICPSFEIPYSKDNMTTIAGLFLTSIGLAGATRANTKFGKTASAGVIITGLGFVFKGIS